MLEVCTSSQAEKQKDLGNVGTIMMEIMEPATSLNDDKSIVLQYPDRWGEGGEVKKFLGATATASLDELRHVRDLIS